MAVSDVVINARARRVLARHWVAPEGLEVGTTDGVVVVKGRLVLEPEGGAGLGDLLRRARLLQGLRSELAGIAGVRQVLIDVDGGQGVETDDMEGGDLESRGPVARRG